MIWLSDENIKNWLPKLQAHRGCWVTGLAQNSMPAITRAYDLGYKMAEFDVRLTQDEVVVLFHDDELKNKLINKYNFSELNEIKPVSTLKQVLDWLKSTNDFKINIEIKSSKIINYKLEKLVCDLVTEFALENKVLISSFNPLSLAKVRAFNSSIYRALLLTFESNYGNNMVIKSGLLNYFAKPHALNIRLDDFEKFKNQFKELSKKIPIVLWTVNDLNVFEKFENDIHGVISDSITPDMLLKN